EWVAQLVGQGREKCVLALAGGADFLGGSAFREIAGDFHKSAENASLITNGGDQHVSPEARAVLPDAPTLVLGRFLLSRLLQKFRGKILFESLGRIEL